MERDVVISGMGVILPNCDSRETLWRQLRDGRSQLSLIPDPADPARTVPAGRIEGFRPGDYLREVPERLHARYGRELQLYLASLVLARDDAGIQAGDLVPEGVGLFDGTSRGPLEFWYDKFRQEVGRPADQVYSRRDIVSGLNGECPGIAASLFGFKGPTVAIAGSCVASSLAIGYAAREICSGEIDVAFATGHDAALLPALYSMYRDAGLLSQETQDPGRALRPYGNAPTLVFGEGAVTLVLEERERAERRGARTLARVRGMKHGNGGSHPTALDAEAERSVRILESLLGAADVDRERIGFVVGHGNGVPISGMAEMNFMRRVFGERATRVPLLSTKPYYGHLLGGADALSIAAAALMLQHGHIIPALNAEAGLRANGWQSFGGEASDCGMGLTFSYGMGGQQAAMLLERCP